MNYRPLGRTGVKVSPLCLGCMNFGWKTDEKDAVDIIHHAIDAGINFIDTANVYSRGRSEEITGKGIKNQRDTIVLATKVHGRMDDDDPNAQGNSRRHILRQCDASLKRLQTDHIDLYQIHRPDSAVPLDETLRALDDLIRMGKVRYVGTSTFAAWQLIESIWIAKELGLNRFVCEQPPYHILDRRIERELVPMALTYGTALIPWSPLAGGFLTGKYRSDKKNDEQARFQDRSEDGHRLFTDETFAALGELETIVKDKECTMSQFALAWCAAQPGITSPIIGPRTMDQLKDNLGALELEITDQDNKRVDEIVPKGTNLADFYNADFGPSRHIW